jgi:hypothetical protein
MRIWPLSYFKFPQASLEIRVDARNVDFDGRNGSTTAAARRKGSRRFAALGNCPQPAVHLRVSARIRIMV